MLECSNRLPYISHCYIEGEVHEREGLFDAPNYFGRTKLN
ncbi:hypothetical protein QFZ77_007266 [Paenibacillus sp. V4I3]|nr:hypothetical protein [Paenibacillus sp. V4I3]MDQ0885535.1 hypothetical protein [Paenibacillus sp. V4I9]